MEGRIMTVEIKIKLRDTKQFRRLSSIEQSDLDPGAMRRAAAKAIGAVASAAIGAAAMGEFTRAAVIEANARAEREYLRWRMRTGRYPVERLTGMCCPNREGYLTMGGDFADLSDPEEEPIPVELPGYLVELPVREEAECNLTNT